MCVFVYNLIVVTKMMMMMITMMAMTMMIKKRRCLRRGIGRNYQNKSLGKSENTTYCEHTFLVLIESKVMLVKYHECD